MKMVIVYPMKIKDEIIPIIELKSKEEHTNKAIVLRQWVYQGLGDYMLTLISKGRMSIGKAAEVLDASIYDIQEMARSKGIVLGATQEQRQKSRENLKMLVKKAKQKKKH